MLRAVLLLIVTPWVSSLRYPREERCCEDNQCFNNNPPLDHLPVPGCPESMNIVYSLYTRNNRDNPDTITKTEIGPNFSGSRRTIFVSHGWNGQTDDPWVVTIKNNALDHGDYNIVLIDWRQGAGDIYYPQSGANTRAVGANTALVMRNLVDNGGASFSNMYCVGHSLGGHVCGHTGKRAQSQIGRITGMDPAGPLFENYDVSGRLDAGDAGFVDIMHTASEGFSTISLGIDKPIGHVDFYPNNGRCQPGCDDCQSSQVANASSPRIAYCSHMRVCTYYAESLTGCQYRSTPCASKVDADNGNCNGCSGDCQFMGIEAEGNSGRGTFYLQTNPTAPHCQG